MKAEEICKPENAGRKLRHLQGSVYQISRKGEIVDKNGHLLHMSREMLDGWEWDDPAPAEVEDWAVERRDGLLYACLPDGRHRWVIALQQGEDTECDGRTYRWVGTLGYVAPDGAQRRCHAFPVWYDRELLTFGEPYGDFYDVRYIELWPTTVQMLRVEV